jgi:hypothetical protein
MWMSEIQIVVDRNNVDHNGLRDIAAAVAEAGAVSSVDVDEDHHVLTATLPAAEVHTVAAMEGVRYVRNVLTYYWAA